MNKIYNERHRMWDDMLFEHFKRTFKTYSTNRLVVALNIKSTVSVLKKCVIRHFR